MTDEDTSPTDETDGPPDEHQQSSTVEVNEISTTENSSLLARLLPDFIRQRLLLKVLFGLVVVILISGGIGIYMYQGISQSLEEDVETQIQATTTLHENAYDNWFSDRRAEVQSVTENINLAGTNYAFISSDLRTAQVESSHVNEFYLVDKASGEILASSNEEVTGQAVADIGIDSQLLEQRSFVSPGQYESQNGYPAIAFGTDASQQNNVNRMLIAEINATEADLSRGDDPTIQQTIEGATTSVVTQDGQQVIGSAVSGEPPAEITENVSIQETGGEIRGYQRVSSGGQFVVVTQTPNSEAFALRNAVLQNFGLTLAITFLILTGVTVVGSRFLAQDLNVLVDRSKAIGSGDLDVDLSTSRIDEIGVLYSEFDTMRQQLKQQIQEAQEAAKRANEARDEAQDARARAEAAREEAETLAMQLEQQAETYSDVMADCAKGNLSRRMPEDANNDAMQNIAESFNEMLDQWEHTIVEIQEFADDVDDQSAQADRSIQEIRDASEQVTEATQNITEATQRQQQNVQDVSREMSQLSATIQEVTATADTVASNADKTANSGKEGQQAAEEALDDLEAIQDQAEVAVGAIEDLNDGMAEISEIVEFINDLADQTNMLALNANIEAARAGEAGSGFAVVANEVKQLAEETQQAAGDITEVIEDIEETTATAVEDIHTMDERVENGSQTVEEALASLNQIADMASDTNVGVQEIKAATDEQATTAQQVSQMTDQVSEIAQTTATETETVAASAQEQSASITEVVDSVEQLSEQSAQLRKLLAEFDVTDTEQTGGDSTESVTVDDDS
jgi:methyl-accepting chemotaxis protein